MTEEKRQGIEKAKRIERLYDLHAEVMELAAKCDIEEDVVHYFDWDSMKNLELKKKVLTRILNGEGPDEIGDDYYKILEKYPKK